MSKDRRSPQEKAHLSKPYTRRNDPVGKTVFRSDLQSHPGSAIVYKADHVGDGFYAERLTVGPAQRGVSFVIDGGCIRQAHNYALALDVDGSKIVAGTTLSAYPCHGGDNQLFTVNPNNTISPAKAPGLVIGASADQGLVLVAPGDARQLVFQRFDSGVSFRHQDWPRSVLTVNQCKASASPFYKRINNPAGKPVLSTVLRSHPGQGLVYASSFDWKGNYGAKYKLGPVADSISLVVDGPHLRLSGNFYPLALDVDRGVIEHGSFVSAFPCFGSAHQEFALNTNGTISPKSAPSLVIGVSEKGLLLVFPGDTRRLVLQSVIDAMTPAQLPPVPAQYAQQAQQGYQPPPEEDAAVHGAEADDDAGPPPYSHYDAHDKK